MECIALQVTILGSFDRNAHTFYTVLLAQMYHCAVTLIVLGSALLTQIRLQSGRQ